MFFNQELRVGKRDRAVSLVTTAVVTAALVLVGCSSSHGLARGDQAQAPASAAPADATASASPAPDLSATEAANAATPAGAPQAAAAPETAHALTRDDLNPGAPLKYTVKHGDTLWGISTLYLKDPWLWPELWYVNPQVANPHLIYPGDTLVLAYRSNGQPEVRVQEGGPGRLEPRLRSSSLDAAIPTIPYSAIAAFLSRPAIVSPAEIGRAPHVLAFRNEHQVGGDGDEAYIRGLGAAAGARFTILHIGEQLHDPDTGRTLGYQGIYAATAVVARAGDPAKVLLTASERETLRGDCLFAEGNGNPLTFVPRAPASQVKGRIISAVQQDMVKDPDIYGAHIIGQFDIVAINRGTGQGVGAGTVLAVDQAGLTATDWGAASYDSWGKSDTFAKRVRLPDERAGTLIVFKSYEDMSFALVIGASDTMRVGDYVHNP
ncbi:MAG TPA: LysM domain-containing protein [Steroidobacteraceae bacterium]|nr:LysM domain-containing protein [Steroidobacteraceae bacterium]